jgi:hypothetical protein
MAKVSPIQSVFNTGEITPLLYGRVDYDNYKKALKTSLNGIALVQGPWTRRPGTYFAAEVKDSTKATRVVRFEFSTTQAYIIEFGDQYMRFYRNNGPVLETAQNITGITQANPAVLTYSGADNYANGDDVEISGIVGMTQLNGRRVRVANVNTGANTFELTDLQGNNIDSSAFTAWSSGGTVARVYTVSTPWLEADLFQLKFTQSADVLYVAHPAYAPRKVTRTAHTAWTVTSITFLDGPYLSINSTATTMTLGATSGSTSLTASGTTGINGGSGFRAGDVGRLVRWKDAAGNWTWLTITAFTSTTIVTVTVSGPNASATTATVSWRMGLWNSVDGYPGAVTFYEDRLTWGGAGGAPGRVDFSKTSDYENMAPTAATAGTVADDNAIAVTLNSKNVQVIRWLEDDEKGLFVGTVSGEWIIRPSNQSAALSPTNVNAKQSTTHGSKNVQAVRAGKATLFVQRAGRKLRELAYVYEVDGFRSPDMTVLAEHIAKGATVATSGFIELARQGEPQSIVWAPRADGILTGFVYERDQSVLGWSRHQIGGWSDAGLTAGAKVESVAVIPAADGSRDELWVIVNRYIDGGTKRYVEYMTKFWEKGDSQSYAYFVDGGLTYDGSATSSGTGAYHLRGQTVQVLADGATHPDVTISALGAWTLTRSASVVHLGYTYNSDGETLRPEAGAADGTAQGKTQRTNRVTFRLHEALGVKVGPSFDKLTRLVFRKSSDDMGVMVPLFNGDKEGPGWEGDYTTDNHICWRFDQPLPGTVLSTMPQLHTQDR